MHNIILESFSRPLYFILHSIVIIGDIVVFYSRILISGYQFAFVPTRTIGDNVFIAQALRKD